ncbi:MAG: acetyl-CoA hydrolase/transferase family protein [Anaerovoracaceae bacterium]
MRNWRDEYKRKLVPLEDSHKLFHSHDRVIVGLITGEPVGILENLAKQKNDFEDVEIIGMGPINNCSFLEPGYEDHIYLNSMIFLNKMGRDAYAERRAEFTPVHGSAFTRNINWEYGQRYPKERLKVVIDVTPMDEHGYFNLALSVGSIHEIIHSGLAEVIVEVNENQPECFGDTYLHITEVSAIVENTHEIVTSAAADPDEKDIAIAGYIADLIEDGSTIQLGIGSMPNVLGKMLKDKKDLGAHSEMIGDAFMELWEAGVLTGNRKTFEKRKIISNFALGSQECYDWIKRNPAVEIRTSLHTNDQFVIAKGNRPVSINQCMEVDLMGQFAAESIGHKQYSGTGGHTDYVAGVQRNPEGKSFICLNSTAMVRNKVTGEKKMVSKIKPVFGLGTPVTTTRVDAQYVVTEYGVAYLRAKSISERANALIAIAHPDFRDELRFEAKKYGYL